MQNSLNSLSSANFCLLQNVAQTFHFLTFTFFLRAVFILHSLSMNWKRQLPTHYKFKLTFVIHFSNDILSDLNYFWKKVVKKALLMFKRLCRKKPSLLTLFDAFRHKLGKQAINHVIKFMNSITDGVELKNLEKRLF